MRTDYLLIQHDQLLEVAVLQTDEFVLQRLVAVVHVVTVACCLLHLARHQVNHRRWEPAGHHLRQWQECLALVLQWRHKTERYTSSIITWTLKQWTSYGQRHAKRDLRTYPKRVDPDQLLRP